MSVLITGIAGFIGTNLSLRLLEEGKKIIGVDDYTTGSLNNLKVLSKYDDLIFIEGSIEDAGLLDRLKDFEIDQIYHLACPTGVPNIKKIPEKMLFTSAIGTKNILDMARAKKAKVLFSSSSEIYGDPKVFPQDESYTGNVNTLINRAAYDEGKRFAETLVYIYAKKYDMDAKIVRIFNTYGRYYSKKDERAVPSFLEKARRNEDLIIYGDGNQKRTFLYIDDLIDGILIVSEKGQTANAYNVGSEKEISINELAHLVIKLTKSKSKIVYKKPIVTDFSARRPSIEKIQKLGWQPKVSLEEGLQSCLR